MGFRVLGLEFARDAGATKHNKKQHRPSARDILPGTPGAALGPRSCNIRNHFGLCPVAFQACLAFPYASTPRCGGEPPPGIPGLCLCPWHDEQPGVPWLR